MLPLNVSSISSVVFLRQMILWNVGYEAKCDELIKENKAIFSLDLVSDKPAFTYSLKVEDEMAEAIMDIVDICDATLMSISGGLRIYPLITSPGSFCMHDIKYQQEKLWESIRIYKHLEERNRDIRTMNIFS